MSRHSVGRPNVTADIVPVLVLPVAWVGFLAWIWASNGLTGAVLYGSRSLMTAGWMWAREDLA